MKDEEMAEEYLQSIEGDDCVIITDREERKQAFLAGLKVGRPQWHDLRKDPNDLPKTPKEDDEWKTVLGQDGNLWFYDENHKEWCTRSTFDNEWGCGTHVPISWCEIPTFDKE